MRKKRRETQRKKSATATARLPFGHFPPCAKALCPMMPQPVWSWCHSDTFSARCAGRRHIGDILHRQDKVAFIKSEPRTQKHTLRSHAHIHKRCACTLRSMHNPFCGHLGGISSVHLSSTNRDVPKGRFLLISARRD